MGPWVMRGRCVALRMWMWRYLYPHAPHRPIAGFRPPSTQIALREHKCEVAVPGFFVAMITKLHAGSRLFSVAAGLWVPVATGLWVQV